MARFAIGGVAYESRLMDGETQTLVLKRMLPAFAALMNCQGALKNAAPGAEAADTKAATAEARAEQRDALTPVVRELAALSDDDVRFILDACLDVTKRQASGGGVGWVDVRQRGLVQDQTDAKFITRLTIAWRVLAENFGDMLASFGLDVQGLAAIAPRT